MWPHSQKIVRKGISLKTRLPLITMLKQWEDATFAEDSQQPTSDIRTGYIIEWLWYLLYIYLIRLYGLYSFPIPMVLTIRDYYVIHLRTIQWHICFSLQHGNQFEVCRVLEVLSIIRLQEASVWLINRKQMNARADLNRKPPRDISENSVKHKLERAHIRPFNNIYMTDLLTRTQKWIMLPILKMKDQLQN